MSLAGDVIDRARDMHPAFTNAQTPQGTALRLLNGCRRTLYNAATRAHRAAFIVTTEYPLTGADVLSGLTLDPSSYLENVRMKVYDDTLTLTLLENAKETAGPYIPRYGVVRGQRFTALELYPRDTALWADTSMILVDSLPILPELVALEDEIGMEVDADQALEAMLAVAMGLRGPFTTGLPPIPLGDFRNDAREATESYMRHLAEQRRDKSFQVSDGML